VTIPDDLPATQTNVAALALVASSVGDPEGTRTITSIVVLLAVLGIALVMIAFWLFRLTRPDKELLAPLEVMGERKWRRADPVWQRRRLDEVRPADAEPLQPSAAPPDFDEAFFERVPVSSGFADLHDDAHAHGEAAPKPIEPIEPAEAESTALDDQPLVDGSAPDADEGRPSPDRPARSAPLKSVSPTPIGIERPLELPDSDIDPDVMAAALAQLDADLQLGRDGGSQASD
jgi:hypothetical protein